MSAQSNAMNAKRLRLLFSSFWASSPDKRCDHLVFLPVSFPPEWMCQCQRLVLGDPWPNRGYWLVVVLRWLSKPANVFFGGAAVSVVRQARSFGATGESKMASGEALVVSCWCCPLVFKGNHGDSAVGVVSVLVDQP